MDNRTTIVEEIENADKTVHDYIREEFIKIKSHPNYTEIISAHIHPLIAAERYPLILEKINAIIS